jgi:hypothetical protein
MSIIGKIRPLKAVYPVYGIIYDLKYIIQGGLYMGVHNVAYSAAYSPIFQKKKRKKRKVVALAEVSNRVQFF